MKHYKMATVSYPSIVKQPLRLIEIPLNKFSEEVIPHHQKNFEHHKAFVHKLIAVNNTQQLLKEIKDKKRCIKQLRDLLYELDTLRAQVEDRDLSAFDTRTMHLRSTILKITKGYQDLEKVAENVISTQRFASVSSSPDERINPFEGASQIQIQADLEELKLQQQQERKARPTPSGARPVWIIANQHYETQNNVGTLNYMTKFTEKYRCKTAIECKRKVLSQVEEIQKKSEDLEEIHRDLHKLVKEQGEQVAEVELNVSVAQENVHTGFKNIVRANKLNAVAYPATGAVVGTLLGGPIGMLAGLKIGGIAAIGCAFAGYAGGQFLRKQKDHEINESDHVINNENNENHSTVTETAKKEI